MLPPVKPAGHFFVGELCGGDLSALRRILTHSIVCDAC